ncbi:MAG TPA: helix-turn-helix transcriptional regulator [Ktedonobacterales bacterium]
MKDPTRGSVAAASVTTTTRVTWRDFGPFLQRVRRRRGISQETLATSLACHRTYIWRLEHGRNHPSRMFLRGLALTYALSAEEAAALAVFAQLREYRLDETETA